MSEADADDTPNRMTERPPLLPPMEVQRLHPVLRTILVFVVGALFGAVCTFFFVFVKLPAIRSVVMRPPAPQIPMSTPAQHAPPPSEFPAPTVPAPQPSMSNAGAVPAPMTTANAGITPTQRLLIPVGGIRSDQLTDTFDDARSQGRQHDAIDIMAPRGSGVLAAVDGTVVKLFNSERGGITLYEFGPDQRFVYYYAHLAEYAPGIVEGQQIKQGQLIGYVGSTGDASPDAPHLHFEVSLLGPERHWWRATAINPYPLLTGR